MAPRTVLEATVLKHRDSYGPHENSDTWPVLELADVNVYAVAADGSRTLANLLHASAHYPVQVVGRSLSMTKRMAHHWISQPARDTLIELTDVRLFSYGAYADGTIDIWAAGLAGWFLIRSPSAAYRAIYFEMTEAVNLLYFTADTYSTPKTSQGSKRATSLPEPTADEFFTKYGKEALQKKKLTPEKAAEYIYGHRIFLLASMIDGKEGIQWDKNPLFLHLRKTFPRDYAIVRQRVKGSANARVKPTPKPASPASSTSTSRKRKRGRPANPGPSDVISIGSSSATSVDSMTVSKRVPSEKNAEPVALRPTRRAVLSQSTSASTTPKGLEPPREDSDTDSTSFARQGRAGLRLKPNKASKGPSRRNNAVEVDETGDEDDPPAPAESLPSRKPPRQASRRIISSRAQEADFDEGISMPTSPSSNSQADAQLLDDEAAADLALRLNHDLDPIQEDTWVCALAGCSHKVYAASRSDSQELIRQHYKLHAFDDDERVRIVKNMQAPSLPIGRLIEKVRLQVKEEGFPGSRVAGTRFPEPLKRKL